ncbi:MAG: pseudouridine synthase [Gammaproteobacteria bacterium]|nr:MAG: pseudouridine synthase [Gammaproteobacteria bacterium]
MQTYINDCLLWQDKRATGMFKSCPEDFVVEEGLDWDFKGQGEHLFLQIEKTNCNTAWVAKQLARFYKVPPRDVGYSGLKDRQAVTKQYFSIRLPGIKPGSYELPEHKEYRVIAHHLHDKKLKRGYHQYNDFTVRLRDVTGDHAVLQQRLAFICQHGCPNFFDSQRFGHNKHNLHRLSAWIKGDIEPRKRDEKGLLLSALRASVFNRQLAERVKKNSWQRVLTGDTVILDGSNSRFQIEKVDEIIRRRAVHKDIHPAGVLVGADSDFVGNSERLAILMRREHLQESYRSFRLNVRQLKWDCQGKDWLIRMRLPTGAYASGVIRQLFRLTGK